MLVVVVHIDIRVPVAQNVEFLLLVFECSIFLEVCFVPWNSPKKQMSGAGGRQRGSQWVQLEAMKGDKNYVL